MKVLELFSGTGSVGKVCKKKGWDVISVDILLPATIKADIMKFDYKQYDKDEFDIVWASPPCTFYSNLQNSWIGRPKKNKPTVTKESIELNRIEADKLVQRTLDIINYFNCDYWFMENPQTGNLKKRDVVKDLPFYDVDYCMYSDWGYKKRTRVWTNKKDFNNLLCNKKCGNMTDNKHNINIGGGSKANNKGTSLHDRYRIPESLIFSLFEGIGEEVVVKEEVVEVVKEVKFVKEEVVVEE